MTIIQIFSVSERKMTPLGTSSQGTWGKEKFGKRESDEISAK